MLQRCHGSWLVWLCSATATAAGAAAPAHLQICIILHRDEGLWVQILSRRSILHADGRLELFRQLEHEVSILDPIPNALVEVLGTHELPGLLTWRLVR
jgi:hypothetical protein